MKPLQATMTNLARLGRTLAEQVRSTLRDLGDRAMRTGFQGLLRVSESSQHAVERGQYYVDLGGATFCSGVNIVRIRMFYFLQEVTSGSRI